MFETISVNVFAIYMSNFNLVNREKLQMVLLITFTNNNSYETDGEYQLQRIISSIALLDDSA